VATIISITIQSNMFNNNARGEQWQILTQ